MTNPEESADHTQRYWEGSHNIAIGVMVAAIGAAVLLDEYWIALAALALCGLIVGVGELLEVKRGDGFVRR